MQTLNSPLEVGLRTVVTLTASFPDALDIDRLLLMDYCLLHSADLGGPESVLPSIDTRGGELAVRRSVLEHGVHLMVRAGMIEISTSPLGIAYRASESAAPFLVLVSSPHLGRISEVATWTATEFSDLSTEQIRSRMRQISNQWFVQATDDRPTVRRQPPDEDREAGL